MSVKYDILNRIGSSNWAPTNHNSSITSALAKLFFKIGSEAKLNFGDYVFEKTMKQVNSFARKLPISFPCLLNGIILNQYPTILHLHEAPNKKTCPRHYGDKALRLSSW